MEKKKKCRCGVEKEQKKTKYQDTHKKNVCRGAEINWSYLRMRSKI